MKTVIYKSLVLACFAAKFFNFESANADFKGPQAQNMIQSNQNLTTVQKVLSGSFHGMKVFLKGNITQKISHDKYTFKDSTGEITIDIDQKHMPFEDFSASDTVMIYGEVEMKRKNPRIEIDVDRVEIVKKNADTNKK
jgi:uncharacterized protein (TIGR00156 family)